MHLIAIDDQVGDRGLDVGAIHGNAKSVATASRSVAARKRLLNVVDVVSQQLDMGAGPHNTYAQGSEPMFSRAEVANFKAFNPHVTLIVDGKHSLSSRGREMPCVKDCCCAGIASEGDESVTRVAGHVDADQFFVDSRFHVHGAARTRGVRSMLNSPPRRSPGPGIRIIPSR